MAQAAPPEAFYSFSSSIVGMVASAANTIYIMGEERLAVPQATFSFHPSTGTASDASPAELEEQARGLRLSDESEALVIKEKTGKSIKEARQLSQQRRQLDAQEALQLGITTDVRPLVIPPGALLLNS